MKRMKRIRNLEIVVYTLLSIILLSACITSKKDVEFVEELGFTRIEIDNDSGEDIILAPLSEDKGAVGVKLGEELVWLTGQPDEISDNSYAWNLEDGIKVLLLVKSSSPTGTNFSFSVEGENISATEWYLNIKSSSDEYFTGIFERVVDGNQRESWKEGITTALNLRGEIVEMHLKPTVSAYAPFYISSNNYGLFVNTTWPGVYDFCKTDDQAVQISFEGPKLDLSWFFGTPLEVVQQHALLTGPSIVPPEWVFGPWRWRDEHFNNKAYYDSTEKKAPFNTDVVEDVLMMKAFDIPATAYWIDRPWGPGTRGFDDYEFDLERIPDPGGMIQWLNSKDLELMMWIGPFVMGDMADYAEERKYYLESNTWRGARQILMDFTNPEALKWWGENGPGKLARMGIKGFKLDRADGEKLLDTIGYITSAGTTYRENYNDYPRQYVKATYDAVKPVLDDDFMLFPRAQFTGSAKYGGMWSGDPNGKPEGLRSVIIGMQRCAIMGYPLWASDIGGYWGTFSRETCMRWIAFGCFAPIMETGPTNNRGFWSNPDEPHYDIELLATWRLYSKIRMELIPYLSELAQEAHESGTPIVRPLFLVYPDQPEAWNDWQTYLLGNDILVSAIWEKDKNSQLVYLPEGELWRDAWNPDEVFHGGQSVEVDAPLHKIPLFIRDESDIDLGDLNELYAESMKKVAVVPDLNELEKAEGWQ